jgi:hypothetical protein
VGLVHEWFVCNVMLGQFDSIKRLITFSVITISGFYFSALMKDYIDMISLN